MLNKRQTGIINDLKQCNKSMIKNIKVLKLPITYYKTAYDLAIKEGVFYSKGSWNTDELDIINNVYSKIKTSIKPGACYKNSQLAIVSDESNMIKYHEGFYFSFFSIFHGWNTLNGKLIDFTLEYANKTAFPEDSHIGIEISKAWVLERFKTKSKSTSYIENHEEGYPVLQKKYVIPGEKL